MCHLFFAFSGVFSDKSLPENPSREKILETFNINSVGPVMTTAKFLPLLKQAARVERPGKIINMSSIAGKYSLIWVHLALLFVFLSVLKQTC